jgi:hypothetical protein
MQAEITLTPTESKKLIAKAIFNLKEFQEALRKGIVAMHDCSSTIFIYEALVGRLPEGAWVNGVIVPRGLCVSKEAEEISAAQGPGPHDPRMARFTWFFKNGHLQEPTPLGEILDQMTETDVYIKGSNAVDLQGNVGVLYANPAGGGGTIGKVMAAQRRNGFHMLLPIGLEKLIPTSITQAIKKAGFKKVDKAMGLPCGLIHVPGKKIDEVDALVILSGAEATPIAAGGLGGAEGSIVLAIHGTAEQVQKAYEICQSVKGAKLPTLNLMDCDVCSDPICHFVPGRKRD